MEYELREGWGFLKKSLRLCKADAGGACLATWEGTVRAVYHWTGLALAKGAYDGPSTPGAWFQASGSRLQGPPRRRSWTLDPGA